MSDYLDNLVARSLGLAEVVLPRPLSLFEPLPSVTGLLAPDDSSLEQATRSGELSASPEPMIDRTAPSAPNAELSENPPAAHREPQSGPPSPHPVQVIDRSASQSTPQMIPHQPVMPASVAGDAGKRADRSEYAARAGQQTVDSHPAVSEHVPLRVVLHATTPADRQSTVTSEATPLISAHTAAPEHGVTLPESIVPAPPSHTLLVAPVITPRPGEPQDRGSTLSDRAELVAPMITPRLDESQHPGSPLSDRAEPIPYAPEAERETAPTIKITIGRVDVRAVMPERPAPRPAPERRNPALSLEEYLKQRSGGKP